MRFLKSLMMLALTACLFATAQLDASYVQQFNLGQMTNNADKIFRGTVVRVESGSLKVGGGELPTVKYVIRVSEMLKGELAASGPKKNNMLEVTMFGSLKTPAPKNGIQHFGGFKAPALKTGKEYLLFTTAPSTFGLSMTVGVEQGLFRFVEGSKVISDAKNAGLFRNMDSQGLVERSPITYSDLAQRIRNLAGN